MCSWGQDEKGAGLSWVGGGGGSTKGIRSSQQVRAKKLKKGGHRRVSFPPGDLSRSGKKLSKSVYNAGKKGSDKETTEATAGRARYF